MQYCAPGLATVILIKLKLTLKSMKNIKTLCINRLLIVCGFAFICYAATAQNTNETTKPHKRTIKARNPKYSEAGEYTYWVQGDTVYNCQVYSGQKIALADIDFNTKEIVKSETLEEGTNNNVYVITLNLIKGKKAMAVAVLWAN